MFIAQCDDRDRLQKYLADHGVQTLVYYGTALHLHKAAEKFGYKRGDFPVAERQCDRVLALPHMQYLSEDQCGRSEEHTSELQSLMRISYAVFCLKNKPTHKNNTQR